MYQELLYDKIRTLKFLATLAPPIFMYFELNFLQIHKGGGVGARVITVL
jgi:hypothetical protein